MYHHIRHDAIIWWLFIHDILMRHRLKLALLFLPWWMLLGLPNAHATTKLYLKSPLSSWNSAYWYCSSTASVLTFAATATIFTSVTNTTASGSNIPMTATAGGTAVKCISPPLAVAATISGTITYNVWAKESNASANATVRMDCGAYTSSEQTAFSTSSFGTEITTTILAKNWTDASPTSTALAIGDRIYCIPKVTNATAMTMGGSQTVTMDRAGKTAAADGDSWIQFNENLSFQSEAEFIQKVDQTATSANTNTVAATFTGTNLAGCTIVSTVTIPQAETATVADNQNAGNYTNITGNPTNWHGATWRSYLVYYPNIAGGTAATVTATRSVTSTALRAISISEYCGVAASPFDVTPSTGNTGTGTAMTSNTATTAFANEIIVAAEDDTGTTFTAGTGFVSRQANAEGDVMSDKSIMAAGSQQATGTISPSSDWYMNMFTLKWGTQPAASTCVSRITLIGAGC